MDLLLNTLTEWLKELLAGAIASNLTGMVDSVNTRVGDIAAQVGQTPQGWNSGIFHMIQNLSNNVILPIAGIILALVMTMEFIRIIMDKNNMHDFDTWSILMWVFKTACAILIVSNTWNIVMAVFDVSQTVVNNAAGLLRPGMYVTTTIGLGTEQVITAPYSTVLKLIGSNDRYVFINENGYAKRVSVEMGQRFGDDVEIIAPEIVEGVELVTQGEARLVDGVKLSVATE